MFRRIMTFTFVPVFTGMALYPLFYYLRVRGGERVGGWMGTQRGWGG